jgi:hypothetical protein
MPVLKCPNGKFRIGTGPCVFISKEKAERAYAAYRAKKHMSENKEVLDNGLFEVLGSKGPGKGNWGHSGGKGGPGKPGGSSKKGGGRSIPNTDSKKTTKLTSELSGYSWSGMAYRGTGIRKPGEMPRGGAALGEGTYYTTDPEVAKEYGTVAKHKVDLKKVLGWHTDEYQVVKRAAMKEFGWLPHNITEEAKKRGYDAIYGGSVFGLVIF